MPLWCWSKEYAEAALKPLPGCTVIYRPWTDLHPGEIDFGSPYCGRCLYSMGIACMPGDDYAI
jgi:hypothetical protein